MSKKNLKYLTATSLSLAIVGVVALPSIALGYDAPELQQWSNDMDIKAVIQSIVNILFSWVAPLCILMIIWGGVMYMTAGDDSGKTSSAFSFIKVALIGLAIVLAAGMLMSFVAGIGSSK